jgi:lipid II:glycine glycyltransferase (peptidoglycan interpeptide bridge formation enzyme)
VAKKTKYKQMQHKLPDDTTSIEVCRKNSNPGWDQFVATISGSNIEQTTAWADFQCTYGLWDEHLRIILYKDQQILGGAQLLIRKYIKDFKIGFIHQGPSFRHANPSEEEALITAIKNVTKSLKLLYVTIDVAYTLQTLPELLIKQSFIKSIDRLPPIPIIESTNILDLSPDLETIKSTFKTGRRQSIRDGLKRPIDIRLGTRDDIGQFFNFVIDTCNRRNIKPLYPDIEYFYQLWDAIYPKNWVVMHFATYENRPICASIGISFGDTYRNFFWGASDEVLALNASSVIDYRSIVWAKENGFLYYDFVQLDTVVAKALESKSPLTDEIKNRPVFGSTFYKLSFGGRIIYYPGNYTYFPSFVIKHLLKLVLNMTASKGIGLRIYRLIRKITFTGNKRL